MSWLFQKPAEPLPPSAEETRATLERAAAAAQARLPAWKEAAIAALAKEGLTKHYGSRPDAFYLRFLFFNEAYFDGKKPEIALTMLLNYCRFMQQQREKGRLDGLGAEMLRPYMNNVPTASSIGGFVRVMSASRDRAGRRLVLSLPADLDDKVPEPMRTRLYLYWFMKLACFEDTAAPGWCIVHDLTGVTFEKAVGRLLGGGEAKEVIAASSKPTFPWILSKIVFVNAPLWLRTSLGMVTPLLPPAAAQKMQIIGDLAKPDNAAALDAVVARAALPAEPPYGGGVGEAWDAGLAPGVGVFFEPEMDAAENQPPR